MDDLVIIKRNEALADSLQVAEMFEKEHSKVIRSIEKLIEGIAKSGDTPTAYFYKTKYENQQNGETYQKYLMNRDGFSLLVMSFNGQKALAWKLKYIEAFNKMEKIIAEKQTAAWIETRKQGMLVRKDETDVIQKLVEYAKEQGSGHADMLYITYTKLANKMAGITKRNEATTAQLNDLSTMERLIAKVVLDGMAAGLHYKEIYKQCKERLETVKGWMLAS